MKPLRLYGENFMCFDRFYIDFTQFSAALIVGKMKITTLILMVLVKLASSKLLNMRCLIRQMSI